MNDTDKAILECLNNIKGSGSFVSTHTNDFIYSGIEVNGIGPLAFPMLEVQAKELIKIAKKAPFGKGSDTIYDENVRKTWEIEASDISFKMNSWQKFLSAAMENIKLDLGIESWEVELELYKLLVYEPSGFFLKHKDSEKAKGMFGTLLIGLPSKHSGGELVVEFGSETETISFDRTCSSGEIAYAAFYADCDHEIKPVTEGYRIVLAYNMIKKGSEAAEPYLSKSEHVDTIKNLLIKEEYNNADIPKIFLLGHQYTPKNFSFQNLKLNDRAKAEILLQAAKEADFYHNLCLITSYKNGMPSYDGDLADGSDFFTIDDVEEFFIENLSIEKWIEEFNPGLEKLDLEEDDILADFAMTDDEPLEKENSGYMGNYGPDLSFWYHYGAVAIWSEAQHQTFLEKQPYKNLLEWLKYYNKATDQKDKVLFVLDLLNGKEINESKVDFSGLMLTIIHNHIVDQGQDYEFSLIEKYFNGIDATLWKDLLASRGKDFVLQYFAKNSKQWNRKKFSKWVEILYHWREESELYDFIEQEIVKLPNYFKLSINSPENKPKPIKAYDIAHLTGLVNCFPMSSEWMNGICDDILSYKYRDYIYKEVVMPILDSKDPFVFSLTLLSKCRELVAEWVANVPQPFIDYTRSIPDTLSSKKCYQILKPFMDSPTEAIMDYRKAQAERTEMINFIQDLDLDHQTISKGSPYTLRMIKNHKSHNKKLKIWNEDSEWLEKIQSYTKYIY